MISSLLLAGAVALAGEAPKTPQLPGEPVQLRTVDGWTLHGRHVAAPQGGRTLLLLHGAGGRKEEWRRLILAAQKRGYGAFAFDFRGHGESRKAPDGTPVDWRKFPKPTKHVNEWANMLMDVQAAVDWLTASVPEGAQVVAGQAPQGGGVLEESIVMVGDHVGGILGLKYAAVHPKIPLMVMLAPQVQYNDVTTVNAMRAYKDRPILLVYSEQDKNAVRAVPILYGFARRAAGERNASLLMVKKDRGPRMLRGPAMDQFLDWLENPVKPETPTEVETSTVPAAVEQGPEEPEIQ